MKGGKFKNIDRCAPSKQFKDGSCIPYDFLLEYVKVFNQNKPKKAIKISNSLDTLNPSKHKQYLLKQLEASIPECNDDVCWLKQDFVKQMKEYKKETENIFRPEFGSGGGKFEWLNTIQIDDVMKQYEYKDPSFKWLGAVPIDFYDLPQLKFKELDFVELEKKGVSKLGIVFNLDKHNEPGSHWVSLYASLKGNVYFFDSYGSRPEPQIRKFMRIIANHIQSKGIKAIVDHNKTRNQYKGSECGVYSLNFIISMLEGKTFEYIEANPVPDDIINKNRNVFFCDTNV